MGSSLLARIIFCKELGITWQLNRSILNKNKLKGEIMILFHRGIALFILLASLIWGCVALDVNPFYSAHNFEFLNLLYFTYIIGFSAAFWTIFYLELIDIIYSTNGKNGKLYKNYLEPIQENLITVMLSSTALASIYWFDSVPYDFSGIDLGFSGFPFLITSLINLYKMKSINVAGKRVKQFPLIIMFIFVLAASSGAFYILLSNSGRNYEANQAIWYQITIFSASFFVYMSTCLQRHFLNAGKIELSFFKRQFLGILPNNPNIYEDLAAPAEQLNKQIVRDKVIYSSSNRKKK